MTFDRVCIVGAGTIGSLCAVHLAQVAEVSVLVRREEHARALTERGLRVTGKSEFRSELFATTDPTAIPSAGLVIVATKATQLHEAVAPLSGSLPEAIFMTIQNGIGAEEVVAFYGSWPIVSSVTFMSGTRHTDDHIEYELDTATWMGPFHPSGTSIEDVEKVGDTFVKAGLKVEVLPDLRPAQWSKLIFNSVVNGVAALTDLPHVGLFARRDLPTDLGFLVWDLIEEGKAVARALDIELFEDPWEMNVEAVSHGQTDYDEYAHVPSMLADVRAGRRTEVDFIIGSLVREADKAGVDVPLSRALYRLVKARDGSYDD
ncbi:MAG: ketopantoate reductase family protein [Acidimicrobiia bacterium]